MTNEQSQIFGLNWKQCPVHGTLCNIIGGVDPEELESRFRAFNLRLQDSGERSGAGESIAVDGKVLRGSADRLQDRKAAEVLGAFLSESHLIIAHLDIENKTNEIPKAQELIGQLGQEGCLFTLDAMHCQKNPSALPRFKLRVVLHQGLREYEGNQGVLPCIKNTLSASRTRSGKHCGALSGS